MFGKRGWCAVVGATVALAAAGAAPAWAGNPHDQTQPSPSVSSIVSPPTIVKQGRGQEPAPGAGAISAGTAGATATSGGCGVCLTQCWDATTRSGPSDWSGSVFIYQHLHWCGNGYVVSYATVWQSYSQSGSYRLDSAYGPWWSGGCIGCYTLRASGYILWSWSSPLISLPSSGTSHLDSTMYAYGIVTL
jgi:hypothetical protein